MVKSVMHAAIEEENTEVILKLIKPGPFKRKVKRSKILNANNVDGHTPLVYAVLLEKKAIIPILLNYGADPNLRSRSGDLPLSIAAGKINQHDVVQLLINANSKVDSTDCKTALMCSAEKGLHLTVGVLIQAGAALDARFVRQTAIMFASENGHHRVVSQLIKAHADLNCTDLDGFTALTIAARNGYSNIVEMLIVAGARTTIKNIIGRTALQLCCMRGLTSCVKLLLNEPNIQQTINAGDNDGMTPLHSAIECANAEIITLLLENGADLHARDNDDRTPIVIAAFFDQVACIKLLLEKKANIEDVDGNGRTPMLTAALYNHAGSCAALLSAGANIEARDKEGRWALALCVDFDKNAKKMGNAGRWTGNINARSEESWRKQMSQSSLDKVGIGRHGSYLSNESTEPLENNSEVTTLPYSVVEAKCSQYSLDEAIFSPVISALRCHVEMAIEVSTPSNFTVRVLDLISDLVFGKCSIDADKKIEFTTSPRTENVSDMLKRLSEIWV